MAGISQRDMLAAASPASSVIPDQKIAFLLVTGMTSGMSIITCGFVMITQGPSFKLTYDRERQRFLAMVSFLAAVFGMFGNGLQLGSHGKSAGDSVASFFFNWLVQVGFAGIAHNSIIRLLTSRVTVPAQEMLSRISKFCCVFYLLTLPVLTPTFIALVNPARTNVKVVARDLNIALVCAVELLATVADVMLLRRFTQNKEGGSLIRRRMIQDMWTVYAFIWFTIAVDIFAKVYRNKTDDLVPDLAVTNLTLTLRAIAALIYGTSVRNAKEIYSSSHISVYGHSPSRERNKSTNAGHEVSLPEPRSQASGDRFNHYGMKDITITTETHVDDGLYPSSKAYGPEV